MSSVDLRDSIEVYLAEFGESSHAIYWTLLALIGLSIAALPVIQIPFTVEAGGVVRPAQEKQEVRFRSSGAIERLAVRVNQVVQRGDTLAVLRGPSQEEEHRTLSDQRQLARDQLADLRLLLDQHDSSSALTFRTARFLRESQRYRSELGTQSLSVARATRELTRAQTLQREGFATASEVESRSFDLAQARAAVTEVRERNEAEWQTEVLSTQQAVDEITIRLAQAKERVGLLTVLAPVAGTIEELTALTPGAFAQPGERLALISPSSTLIAEVVVPPGDVGLLTVGSPVRLHIDAFPATTWGVVRGSILTIAGDSALVGGQAVFRVRCALDAESLRLPNGVEGDLRKGMTLRARFQIVKRSLWQLLFDDMGEWLEPLSSDG